MKRLSIEKIEKAIQLYTQNNLSSKEIGDLLGVEKSTIIRNLKREGILIKDSSHCQQKYEINEACFDNIYSEQAQYWLGFLLVDGHINRGSQLEISIKETDKVHLENLKTFLESTHPLKTIKGSTYCPDSIYYKLSIKNKKLCQKLVDYGFTQSKENRLPSLDVLSKSKHFWRGVMDGDGWLGISNNKPRIDLVGYSPLLNLFKGYVNLNFPSFKGEVKKHKNIYRLQLICTIASEITYLLYENNNISLARKDIAAAEVIRNRGLENIAVGTTVIKQPSNGVLAGASA